tara:strand:+ start:674 stop:1612 length:939 start_codon:yes stop_codon:yes gene_type:complete
VQANPALLQKILLSPKDLSTTLSWEAVFGRKAPLCVEVGFGNGEFLTWWSGKEPDKDFVGIEMPRECIVKACAELEVFERGNVRLVQGDARYLLRELFPYASIEKVLMQFPLPWPKDKHAKHRVIGSRWAATLADVLVPGGGFELITDQGWYAEEAAAAFSNHGGFQVSAPMLTNDRPFMTRYEKKWEKEGRETWKVEAILIQPFSADRFFLTSPVTHHHLPALPSNQLMKSLKGARFQGQGNVVEVKEVFGAESGWLLKMVASDESFSQIYFVRIANRSDGRALLKLEEGSRPFWTRAVRFGLDELEKRLS